MSGQREDLEWLREGLLAAFELADVAVKAQIAGQLRAVVKDLAGLGVAEVEVSVADQLAAKRSSRRSGADDQSLSPRRGQPRRSG